MEEHWYKEAIIYELHVKCFFDGSGDGMGDFNGLTQKLDYLQDLGITAIWLLPFYPSPLKDDGYDIADYTDVHPYYGNLRDFKIFLQEAHKRGLKVITELVVNHTSDQHAWFQKARISHKNSKDHKFYVWSDTPDLYKEARVIFQDFESSNWSWDPLAKRYFWHRFYSHQPDLNFNNPAVHQALFRVLSFWMKLGVDGIRLDAVPYLYEKEGTNCENLSETHEFLKKLRKYVDDHFEERMLLAEANQWPEDAAKYFGEGDECHMAFHFPVMPRLFMAIHLEDSLPITEIMGQTPMIPDIAQWALFLRNHDELTLEMVTDEERDYMFRVYANDPQARLNLGIRRRLAPLLKNDRRKIELMNTLLFSLTGTPVLYYGDELGMGDNIYLGDRNGVRTPMQWSSDRNAGFSRANPQSLYLPPIIDPEYHYETVNVEAQQNNPYSLYWWTRQMISLRKRFKAFGYGTTNFLIPKNQKVLVFFREYQNELIMIIANLSRSAQYVELDLKKYNGFHLIELFSGQRFPNIGELPYFLTLGPYGYYWFALEKEPQESFLTLLEKERARQVAEVTVKRDERRIFHVRMRRLLDSVVKRYLVKRGWMMAKMSMIDRTKIRLVDHAVLFSNNEEKIYILFIEVVFTSGLVNRYPIYLTVIQGKKAEEILDKSPERIVCKFKNLAYPERVSLILDVSENQMILSPLIDIMQKRKRLRTEEGEIRGKLLVKNAFDGQIEIKDIRQEEEAVFFTFGEKVVKVFTLIEEGMNLDVETRLFLTNKTTFRQFLPIIGYIEYKAHTHTSVALAEEIGVYHTQFSCKEHAIEAADRFLVSMGALKEEVPAEPKTTLYAMAQDELSTKTRSLLGEYLEVAHLLGETTADFHLALNSQPLDAEFASVPLTLFYQRSLYQNLRRKTAGGIGFLKQNVDVFPEDMKGNVLNVLKLEKKIFSMIQLLPHVKLNARRSRHHGDYKLDHLFYTGKEIFITNLNGNLALSFSERKYKRSPLLDTVSMLLSITDASFHAVQRLISRGQVAHDSLFRKWSLFWSEQIGVSFLRAYLQKAKKGSFLPENPKEIDFLLLIFLLESCFQQILAEGAENISQIEAPIAMLNRWLPIYDDFKSI